MCFCHTLSPPRSTPRLQDYTAPTRQLVSTYLVPGRCLVWSFCQLVRMNRQRNETDTLFFCANSVIVTLLVCVFFTLLGCTVLYDHMGHRTPPWDEFPRGRARQRGGLQTPNNVSMEKYLDEIIPTPPFSLCLPS